MRTFEFIRKQCGQRHVAVWTSHPGLPEDDRAKIRAAWHRTIDDPSALEGLELKLSLKYFSSFPSEGWELPDTIVSRKTLTGFVLLCKEHLDDV